MNKRIFIETSCILFSNTGIGKTIKILIDELKKIGYEVICISPELFNKRSSFLYYNYYIPKYCRDNLDANDVFLIPNNMGKFWFLPHERTWVLMHDLIPLTKYGYQGCRRWLYLWKTKKIRKAERIITISYYVKKQLCDMIGVDESLVKVIYWPITISNVLHIKKNKKQFLSIGTGEPRKCIDWLLNNWALSAPTDSTLLLYGGEWRKGISHNILKNIIKKQKIENEVRIIGRVTEIELARLYASSHVFIFPSMEEGFGLPPLEALSNGCNIILPKTPVNIELYGTIAKFYSPGDVEELKNAINDSLAIDEKENILFSQQFSLSNFESELKKVFKV